jgi:DNA invertase Pin-like site-specific DNA recombinase
MAKPKRAAIYLQVSTDEQITRAQQRELEAVAVYEDAGLSGAKGRDKRPGLDAMLKDATRRRFDVVMAWNVGQRGTLPD